MRGCYHAASMELIVILVGEALFLPFIAALTVVLEVVGIVIGVVLEFIGARIARVARGWLGSR